MKSSIIHAICGILWTVFCLACHGRSAFNPEDLVLSATGETASLVQATVAGMVTCGTCGAGSGMIIEVVLSQSPTSTPLTERPFGQVGAYEVTVKVLPLTRLVVRALVYAPGGVLTGQKEIAVPEGNAHVGLTVNLDVPS